MSRPINDAYAAVPDFFENLITAYSPIGVSHIDFSEHVLKRLFSLRLGNSSAQTLG
jgi:hypothetical protein